MANDSQRDKARATFGKTFFENSKALPNPKNAAAALQKRANDRPIPTYKVGGAVKKSTPPQPTAAEREADRKRRESLANTKVTQSEADALGRAMRSEGPRYKDGGKANAGAKRAMKAEQDFTGLMRDAAARAAAKGTPVMKDGGATNEYTAKRVMSRIKAGNFKEGGRAELLRDRRMKDIEKDYKIALAKGKNEGVAKAKYEQRMADAADDYAKRTKGDRTATRAAEKASEATLKEARSTKGASITRRDMAADFKKYFADKPMTAKAAEPAKAAETAAAAKPKTRGEAFKAARKELGAGKTFTYEGKSYSTNFASEGLTGTGKGRTGTGRTGTGRVVTGTGTGTGRVVTPAAASAAATPPPPPPPPPPPAAAVAKADKPKSNLSSYNAGRSPGILSGIGSGKRTGYQGRGEITVKPQTSINAGRSPGILSDVPFGSGKRTGYQGRGEITVQPRDPKKLAAGGAGKVRKGMMKGK
jgi:hypothetical protein